MSTELTAFERSAAPRRAAGQATMVEQSRAVAEVQAAVVIAQQRPRDIQIAIAEMRQSAAMPYLAERAFFRFPRGGQTVSGKSVHLARELARCWGNIVYGVKELRRDDGAAESEMMAYAWDIQTNARNETVFIVPHKRDKRGGAETLTDMRDIYENNANNGARRLRECIFAVMPPWYVEEAAEICSATLKEGGGKPLPKRIADCIANFKEIGVSREQLERKVERASGEWTPEDVAQLGVVFKSLKRGEVSRDEEFPRDPVHKQAPAGASDFEKASAGTKASAASEAKPQPQQDPADAQTATTAEPDEWAEELSELVSGAQAAKTPTALANYRADAGKRIGALPPAHQERFRAAYDARMAELKGA